MVHIYYVCVYVSLNFVTDLHLAPAPTIPRPPLFEQIYATNTAVGRTFCAIQHVCLNHVIEAAALHRVESGS